MNRLDDFPDVNVWVALSSVEHAGHAAAKRYFEDEHWDRLAFGWGSAMGLLRVTSRHHTFGGVPLSPRDAWANLEAWLEHPDVVLLHEPVGLRRHLANWAEHGVATSRNWSDLYLAAFAMGHNLRLVTFDQAFQQLPSLRVLTLHA